jgi:membrane protein
MSKLSESVTNNLANGNAIQLARFSIGLLSPLNIFRLIKRAIRQWINAGGLSMSAAMSFYGLLSLAPLLVMVVGFLGWWLDRSYIETNLIREIGAVIGVQGAQMLKQALASAQEPTQGLVASAIAFVLLIFGATGIFAEMQAAFGRLWRQDGQPAATQKWWYGATLRLRGIACILAFGFLLLVSLSVATFFRLLSTWASEYLPVAEIGLLINEVISFGFCVALFVALMRMSAGPKPASRFLIFGACVGAVLFSLGKHLLAFYLSTAAVVSAYGAAGSLVVILMWIYFSSAVLLLAASVARAWSDASIKARAIHAAHHAANKAESKTARNEANGVPQESRPPLKDPVKI